MFDDKLYVTHLTTKYCRSFLIENSKQALDEWYQEHLNIATPEDVWEKVDAETKSQSTFKVSTRDEINNVYIHITG